MRNLLYLEIAVVVNSFFELFSFLIFRSDGTTRPLCKFFYRGKCHFGRDCKYLHPGENDRPRLRRKNAAGDRHPEDERTQQLSRPVGPATATNATTAAAPGGAPIRDMREMLNARVQPDGAPLPPPPPPGYAPPVPPMETAWERGLRMAKERLKKAKLKTATETNLEDKKANMSVLSDDINTRHMKDKHYRRSLSPLGNKK